MANVVQFVYALQSAYDAAVEAGNISANTIYFIKDGDLYKIYRGEVLYDGTTPVVAAALNAFKTAVGTWPENNGETGADLVEYDSLVDYIQKLIASGNEELADALTALDNSLADVAKSGAAEDISIEDTAGKLNATNVEDALAELADAVAITGNAANITIESASGAGDVLTTYDFYQGVLGSDDAAAKAAKKIGTINIPKDYLVRSATIETVETVDTPYTGAAVGDKYIDFVVNTKDGDTGTPQHMYIALNDLVAVMQGSVGSEITVTIGANNTIQATVNKIAASKIIYQEAAEAQGTEGQEGYVPAVPEQTVAQKIVAIEAALGAGLASLDADVDAATPTSTDAEAVGVVSGITEENGIITAVDTAEVDAAGAATRAKEAVIGTTADTTTAITIHGTRAYIDDKIDNLDADLDAVTPTAGADAEAVAVMSGVTEANGIITAVDTAYADAAGAASRAKAEIIGTTADLAGANTLYGAKAYADSAVDAALSWGSL